MSESNSEVVFEDVACSVCACVCDDLRLTVKNGRIVDYQPFCSRVGNWFEQQNSIRFPAAMHAGVKVSVSAAIQRASQILSSAKAPLFYGLSQSSTEGQRAALALADYLGATIDTTASEGHAPSILALQQVGESTCSLGEIRNRADLIIYWGSDPLLTQPRHIERYSRIKRCRSIPAEKSSSSTQNAHTPPIWQMNFWKSSQNKISKHSGRCEAF